MGTIEERLLLGVARLTRPCLRNRTPVLHRLCRLLLRIVCPRGRVHHLVAPYGSGAVRIDTGSALEYSLLFRGVHEPAVVRWIERVVRPGAVCLDIGANVGAHTLVMAWRCGPQGRVLAFEPHPEVCSRLRENIALNALEHVAVVEAAVSNADGEAVLHGFAAGAFRRGLSSLVPDERTPDAIPVHTLDGARLEERFRLRRCDLVKIDVEGHDSAVLQSLLPLIERLRPTVIFEYRRRRWERAGASLAAALEALTALDYTFRCIDDDVSRPLDASAVPAGCEIVCLPAAGGY